MLCEPDVASVGALQSLWLSGQIWQATILGAPPGQLLGQGTIKFCGPVWMQESDKVRRS